MKLLINPIAKRVLGIMLLLGVAQMLTAGLPETSMTVTRGNTALVFTDPQIAWCGLSEAQAKSAGIPYQVSTAPWATSGRAVSMGRTDGRTKLIVDPDTKLLLGMGMVGAGAAELIAQGVLALERGAEVGDLASSIQPHPTLSELIGEAARQTDSGSKP